jgi:hypothetical protein
VLRSSLLTLTAGLVLCACHDPPAEVVIDTRVGDGRTQAQREQAAEEMAALFAAGWDRVDASLEAGPRAASVEPESGAGAADEVTADTKAALADADPDATPAELALREGVRAIREGPIDDIGQPVHALTESDPSVWPEVRELLLAERERPKREYKQVLAVIGGDVPNRYGHFDLHWKKAHGYDVRLSEDWFEDLLALETKRVSKLLRPVYRDLLLTAALAKASVHIAHADPELVGEVSAALLDAAYVHEGTFRDEIGRAIDGLGDPALPHLLRESVAPEDADEGSVPERRAAYATYCLDRMDRLHPRRALEAVSDDRRLLASVLAAYGIVRDGEAAPLILEHIDADAPQVRHAARDAFMAYVTGPLPQVRRKSIRLLGGRTSTQRAELSYREHARLAIRDRIAADEPELLEPECRLVLEHGLVDPECERQPERLFLAYLALLDERRASRRDALIARALGHSDPVEGVAMLDTLLTDGTEDVDPTLLAPFYVDVAEQHAQRDPARAAQLLRKSAMLLADLEPETARALTVDALVLEAGVDELDLNGREMLLATAAELDADDPRVSAAVTDLARARHAGDDRLHEQLTWSLLVLFGGLGLLTWIASLIHRDRGSGSTSPSRA